MQTILESIDAMLEPLMELTFKKVVRHGQIVRKLVCPDGYKSDDGRCVRMSMMETKKRVKAAKKGMKTKKRTFRGASVLVAYKSQKKSNKLRKMRGL